MSALGAVCVQYGPIKPALLQANDLTSLARDGGYSWRLLWSFGRADDGFDLIA